MIIDNLTSQDLQGLKALYEDGFDGSKSDLEKMTKTFEIIRNNPAYNILCARIEGKVVGSVLGVICCELFGQCQPFMVVEDVVVLNAFRRRGIAKQLLIKLEERAVQHNCSMILFVSSAHRAGAHKLYESLGFAEDKVNGYRKRLK